MHTAPAVSYPVGRSHLQVAAYLGVWLLGGCAGMAWSLQSERLAWGQGLYLLFWLVSGFVLMRDLRRTPRGVLRWDGQQWHWAAGRQEYLGQAWMRLDLQSHCLVEFRPERGSTLWLWPQRSADAVNWHALRRALSAPLAQNPAIPGVSDAPVKGAH